GQGAKLSRLEALADIESLAARLAAEGRRIRGKDGRAGRACGSRSTATGGRAAAAATRGASTAAGRHAAAAGARASGGRRATAADRRARNASGGLISAPAARSSSTRTRPAVAHLTTCGVGVPPACPVDGAWASCRVATSAHGKQQRSDKCGGASGRRRGFEHLQE